ncbi:MAG: porin family protein [Cellvibrionaceae bacterium]|nr:porin family protein [Cellvibrionaceae bacterium]
MKQGTTQLTNKLLLAAALACSSFAMASSAYAQSNDHTGPYIGANYGMFKSRGDDFEDDNNYYEILAGYRFLPFLGVEVNYADFGEFGGDFASADVDGWGVAAVGFLPLSDSFNIYAKAGQFFSTVDVNVAGFNDDFDDEQIFYGVGVNFVVAQPLNISIEYNRYKVEVDDSDWPVQLSSSDTDIDTIKVGAKFTF